MAFNNPFLTLASNIGAWIRSKSHLGVQSWGFNTLFTEKLADNITLGAGLTGSAMSAVCILPQACKIPKVAIGFGAIDLFNGTETFNIVVEACGDYNSAAGSGAPNPTTGAPGALYNTTGTPFGGGIGPRGASYTAGAVQTTPPGDNSGFAGYPTQFASVGNALFANDIKINATNFTNTSAGTSGASQVFVPTEWDAVFAAGTMLSLRAVTTSSTGSIANLCIELLCQTVDTRPVQDRAVPNYGW